MEMILLLLVLIFIIDFVVLMSVIKEVIFFVGCRVFINRFMSL